ncbi:MAG: hypothetical protein R3F48_16935 [Candidatus Zixiibacteriota bacterium]
MNRLIVLIGILLIGSGLLCASESTDAAKTYPYIRPEFSERFRIVYWDNAISLSDAANAERAFTRHRTSAGLNLDVSPHLSFLVKLTNEFRLYSKPTQSEWEPNEIVFDQLFAKIINPFDLPMTVTIGRQNIILGEGFVILEGHPLDGSRTIYFNAVRMDFTISKSSKLTAFYSKQRELDRELPRINDQHQYLTEQPEDAFCLYFTHTLKPLTLEHYYIYKKINNGALTDNRSDISTTGIRTFIPISKYVSITSEFAYQWGNIIDSRLSILSIGRHNKREAYAGYFYMTIKPRLMNKLVSFSPGTFYYSGDHQASSRWEGWEPVFGRWPKWSESYIYTQINEMGVAYWTNIQSIFLKTSIELPLNSQLIVDYHHLIAPEGGWHIFNNNKMISGKSKNRGDLIIAQVKMKYSDHWSGHFLWETFLPNRFYKSSADRYNWIRFEVMYTL